MSFLPCGVLRRQPGHTSVAGMDLMSMNGMVAPARWWVTEWVISAASGVVVSENLVVFSGGVMIGVFWVFRGAR